MSVDPAILRAMQGAGCTVDQILAVVEADAAVDALKLADKRAKAAERKRRQRSRDVTGTERDIAGLNGTARDTPLKETPPTPPKEIHPPLPPSIPDGMDTPAPEIVVLKEEHVIEAYSELAQRLGLPPIRKMTGTREKHLRNFVRRNSIDEVRSALDAIERSAFLRGENERGWRADFDFLLQPKSFAKLIEGAYDH